MSIEQIIEQVHGALGDAGNPEASLLFIGKKWQKLTPERDALLMESSKVVQVLESALGNPQSTMGLGLSGLQDAAMAVQRRANRMYMDYREGRDRMEVMARLWDCVQKREPLGQVDPSLTSLDPSTLSRLMRVYYAGLTEGMTAIHGLGEQTSRFFLEMAGKAPLSFEDQGMLVNMGYVYSRKTGIHLFMALHAVMRTAAELAARMTTAEDAPFIWSPAWQTDPQIGSQIPFFGDNQK